MDEEIDEHSIYGVWRSPEPVEVAYNAALPPDAFDVIIIDECHRSIYGPVASGAGVFRRAPYWPYGYTNKADVRVLPPELGDGVLA